MFLHLFFKRNKKRLLEAPIKRSSKPLLLYKHSKKEGLLIFRKPSSFTNVNFLFYVLQSGRAFFAGSYLDNIFDIIDEDFAIPDISGI